ncbi:MAG: hypothetical protein MJ252_09540, partial [archaeon]|nr:hypothetical protein [archaeon]
MGQAFSACNCLSGPQKEMVLATDRGEHRETSLKLQETLNRTKKCHKVDTSFTHMKILSKLFSSQKDLNAEKIQKVYRGHNYRKNVFPKEKQKLLKEEEKYLKDLNKKYITTDLKSYEKLFDLKLSNPQIKTFLKEIDSDVFKYSKAKTSDKTNSNYQKNKIIVRPYNGIPSFYQGQINEFNEPHGEGILYNEFGCKYDGTFFNGEFTGYGKYIDSLGNCYEG